MSDLGERIAAAALALVGTPFRLGGRTPSQGIDCIGLVALALANARQTKLPDSPSGYALRNCDTTPFLKFTEGARLETANGTILAGDILHTTPGPAQDHLLVALGPDRFVHAHASLRRVVVTPGQLADPVRNHWRAI